LTVRGLIYCTNVNFKEESGALERAVNTIERMAALTLVKLMFNVKGAFASQQSERQRCNALSVKLTHLTGKTC